MQKINILIPIGALLFVVFMHSLVSATSRVDKKEKIYDVIIVGGGIAGLTAAFYLDDYDLLLLEKEKQVGGRASSGVHEGIHYAKGPEYLGLPEHPLKEIISTLHLNLREIPAPADIIAYGGNHYIGEAGKINLMVKNSSRGEFNRFVSMVLDAYKDYDEIPDLDLRSKILRLDTITAQQWFEENHFSPIYHQIYNVAFRGLFGANINEISALNALPELAFEFEGFEALEDEESIEESVGESTSTGMYSFDNGIAEIPIALANYLGQIIQTETTVTGIHRSGDLFEVSCSKADTSTTIFLAESVIVATPAPITLDIAADILNKEQQQLLSSVTYSSYATVALFSEEPVFNKGFDLAVPDGFMFTDIYDATWIQRNNKKIQAPQQNWITLLYASPLSYLDTNFIKTQDTQFASAILEQLDTLLPGSAARVKNWEITRFKYGFPVMLPGSYQRMSRLESITDDGLFLAGDYVIYPTFEAAASSGYLAAQKVIEWLAD